MRVTLVDIQLPAVERKEGHRLAREPIGLLELGAFIRRETRADMHYAIVTDCNSAVADLLNTTPDAIGFSTYSYNYPFAVQLAQGVKETRKEIRVAFGGPHAGMIPKTVLDENPGTIDCCIADEGELGFLDFLNGANGVIKREKIPLDQVAQADRLDFLLDNTNFGVLGYERHKTAVVLASRGCTRSCDFCITRLSGYRSKPQDMVIDEITVLQSEHGVEVIIFEDPLLNGSIPYLTTLTDRLATEKERGTFGKNLYFIGVCDFNFGRDYAGLLKKMAKAGFIQLNWGVEDPRQEFRRELNKKTKVQSEVLSAAHQCGIHNRGLLMLPTHLYASDPEADIKEYVEHLTPLCLDEVKINVTTPFPGTPLYDLLSSSGKIAETDWRKYDTHHLVFQSGKWTQEIIDWGRKYIVCEFEKAKKR